MNYHAEEFTIPRPIVGILGNFSRDFDPHCAEYNSNILSEISRCAYTRFPNFRDGIPGRPKFHIFKENEFLNTLKFPPDLSLVDWMRLKRRVPVIIIYICHVCDCKDVSFTQQDKEGIGLIRETALNVRIPFQTILIECKLRPTPSDDIAGHIARLASNLDIDPKRTSLLYDSNIGEFLERKLDFLTGGIINNTKNFDLVEYFRNCSSDEQELSDFESHLKAGFLYELRLNWNDAQQVYVNALKLVQERKLYEKKWDCAHLIELCAVKACILPMYMHKLLHAITQSREFESQMQEANSLDISSRVYMRVGRELENYLLKLSPEEIKSINSKEFCTTNYTKKSAKDVVSNIFQLIKRNPERDGGLNSNVPILVENYYMQAFLILDSNLESNDKTLMLDALEKVRDKLIRKNHKRAEALVLLKKCAILCSMSDYSEALNAFQMAREVSPSEQALVTITSICINELLEMCSNIEPSSGIEVLAFLLRIPIGESGAKLVVKLLIEISSSTKSNKLSPVSKFGLPYRNALLEECSFNFENSEVHVNNECKYYLELRRSETSFAEGFILKSVGINLLYGNNAQEEEILFDDISHEKKVFLEGKLTPQTATLISLGKISTYWKIGNLQLVFEHELEEKSPLKVLSKERMIKVELGNSKEDVEEGTLHANIPITLRITNSEKNKKFINLIIVVVAHSGTLHSNAVVSQSRLTQEEQMEAALTSGDEKLNMEIALNEGETKEEELWLYAPCEFGEYTILVRGYEHDQLILETKRRYNLTSRFKISSSVERVASWPFLLSPNNYVPSLLLSPDAICPNTGRIIRKYLIYSSLVSLSEGVINIDDMELLLKPSSQKLVKVNIEWINNPHTLELNSNGTYGFPLQASVEFPLKDLEENLLQLADTSDYYLKIIWREKEASRDSQINLALLNLGAEFPVAKCNILVDLHIPPSIHTRTPFVLKYALYNIGLYPQRVRLNVLDSRSAIYTGPESASVCVPPLSSLILSYGMLFLDTGFVVIPEIVFAVSPYTSTVPKEGVREEILRERNFAVSPMACISQCKDTGGRLALFAQGNA